MSLWTLPPRVQLLLEAIRVRDPTPLLVAVNQDAVLIEGHGERHGRASIIEWVREQFEEEVRPLNEATRKGETVLTVLVGVAAEPGVDQFDWRFRIGAERIDLILVEPHSVPALPPPIKAFVRAMNLCDLKALLSEFAHDALVKLPHRNQWGAVHSIRSRPPSLHLLDIARTPSLVEGRSGT